MQTLIQAFNMQTTFKTNQHQMIFAHIARKILSFKNLKKSLIGSIFCFALFACSFNNKLLAQYPIKVNVQVLPPYSPFLNDYLGFKNKTVLTITNTSSQDRNIYLKATLSNSQNFVAKTKDNYLPAAPIFLKAGQMTSLLADENLGDSFKEENLDIDYGNYNLADIIRDGVMPDGSYTLCVTAYDFSTQAQLSDENMGCKSFIIRYLNAPKILNCSENKKVFFQNPQIISFNWSPIIGNVQGLQIVYDLYISKMNPEDNPQDIIEAGIVNNTPNIIKISGIPTNAYTLSNLDPILEQGKYAWAVKARVEGQAYPIENDGLSNVCTIDYSDPQMNVNGDPQMNNMEGKMNFNPECSCKAQLPNNLSNLQGNPLGVGSIIKSGKLLVTLTSINKTDKGFSGTGTVPLPIINTGIVKVNVSFKDINIQSSNNEYYQTSGLIQAVIQADASFLPKFNPIDPGSMNMDPGQVQSLSTYFEKFSSQLISKIKNYPNTIAYDLPIGMDEKVMTIAITNLTLTPEQSYFDAITVLDMIDGNAKIALAGQGICVDQNSFCGEEKLFLVEDFAVPAIGIKLKGGFDIDKTSITFDKEGFKNLRIVASYTFPENSLIDVNNQKPAEVTLATDTKKGWNDWIADVDFKTFYISGFPEMTFGPDNQGTKIFYDHSDTRNPDGIPMPYTSQDSNDPPIPTDQMNWRGFYIPSISINLPASLTNINGKQLEVKAEKLIFSEGLSGNISVNNIMSISDGSLDGWYYSIDQFKINLWKNTFKSSSMSGKMVLPLSLEYKDVSNQLNYTCTLSKPANSGLDFNFLVDTKDNIKFNVFWAKCNLIKGTNIQILKNDNQKFIVKAELWGQLAVVADIKNIPNINIVDVHFEKLSIQSQKPYFSPGQSNANFFTMASPQHSIAGFSIEFDPTPGKGISLYHPNNNPLQFGLTFKAQLKLVKDVDFVPKADVEFNVYGEMKMNGSRPEWAGIDANISKIAFKDKATIGPIGVDGELAYFNDNNGSYGFMGKLTADIAQVVTVSAKAQFGYSANEGGFNYFFIDAMADFKEGVPLPPAMAIYGFGGGVFYNMDIPTKPMDGNNISKQVDYVFDKDDPQAGISLSGVVYTPKKGLFSVKAAVLFGLQTRNVLDADGSVTMTFNANTGSVVKILFVATGRFITKIDEPLAQRNINCMGYLLIAMEMNFDEKSFLFHAEVTAGVPTHSDEGLFSLKSQLDFYAGPSGWFVHVGRPWKTRKIPDEGPWIHISVLHEFTFNAYFQCGEGSGKIWYKDQIVSGVNAVDPMPPIPDFITEILGNNNRNIENGDIRSESSISAQEPNINGGLAFGANFDADLDVTFLIFYLKARIMIGFDLGFYSLGPDAKCVNEKGEQMEKGVNGFYAKGQAYLGAKIDVGIDIDLFFFSGKISIISAGVAAYVQFGAPQPSYATGALGGNFSVLGGLIEGAFAVKFYWGEKCFDVKNEAIDLISMVNPSADFDKTNYSAIKRNNELQPVYLQPYATFNYQIDKTFLIIVPVSTHNQDDPSETYREYRYYHIMPSDIAINLSGGQILQEGQPITLNFNSFKVSTDNFTLQLKNTIMLEKDKEFKFDIKAKVKICNLGEDSKNQAAAQQGYKSEGELAVIQNRPWKDAVKDGKVYYDERHVSFKTDCGIKKILDEWVTDINPLHRSQNNPTGYSKPVVDNQLRRDSYFKPVYNQYAVKKNNINQMLNKTTNIETSTNLTKNEIVLNTDNNYFDERIICIPAEFANNFDFKFKISTFGKSGSGPSFKTKLIPGIISGDKKTISAKLSDDFPGNSYVVVQVILKKKPGASSGQKNNILSEFKVNRNFKVDSLRLDANINSRTVSLESKIGAKVDEMELFRWYFTTGKYNNYREKMEELSIKRDTITKIQGYVGGNKSQINQSFFKVLESTYSFSGLEKFDFHDIDNYKLASVFDSNPKTTVFSKKLADGYLGFAFDNASQDLVDGFLRQYFDNEKLEMIWSTFKKEHDEIYTYESDKADILTSMNSYITGKMFDATKWENVNIVQGKVLQALALLPSDLIFNNDISSTLVFGETLTSRQKLFEIKKTSEVLSLVGSKSTLIPSLIINSKNWKDNMPGHGPIVMSSYLADVMNEFNSTIEGKIYSGFNPIIVNKNFKK